MRQFIWKPEGMFQVEDGAWLDILEVDAARLAEKQAKDFALESAVRLAEKCVRLEGELQADKQRIEELEQELCKVYITLELLVTARKVNQSTVDTAQRIAAGVATPPAIEEIDNG